MTPLRKDFREVLEILREQVAEWERSPYYLPDPELFDLERFLEDYGYGEWISELERVYGKPLNEAFWKTLLPYHKLKKARHAVKAQEIRQEERRTRYLQSLRAYQEAVRDFLKRLAFDDSMRPPLKIVPADDSPSEP